MSWKLSGTVALAFLLAAVLILSMQNQNLREQFHIAFEKTRFAYVGMYVPELTATNSVGQHVVLGSPSGRKQLLFVFNVHCPHCRTSMPAARRIWDGLDKSSSIELIALTHDSSDETASYLKEFGFDIPFVSLSSERGLALLHAASVPQLMLIGENGQVEYVHIGEIAMDDVDAIVAAVDIFGS